MSSEHHSQSGGRPTLHPDGPHLPVLMDSDFNKRIAKHLIEQYEILQAEREGDGCSLYVSPMCQRNEFSQLGEEMKPDPSNLLFLLFSLASLSPPFRRTVFSFLFSSLSGTSSSQIVSLSSSPRGKMLKLSDEGVVSHSLLFSQSWALSLVAVHSAEIRAQTSFPFPLIHSTTEHQISDSLVMKWDEIEEHLLDSIRNLLSRQTHGRAPNQTGQSQLFNTVLVYSILADRSPTKNRQHRSFPNQSGIDFVIIWKILELIYTLESTEANLRGESRPGASKKSRVLYRLLYLCAYTNKQILVDLMDGRPTGLVSRLAPSLQSIAQKAVCVILDDQLVQQWNLVNETVAFANHLVYKVLQREGAKSPRVSSSNSYEELIACLSLLACRHVLPTLYVCDTLIPFTLTLLTESLKAVKNRAGKGLRDWLPKKSRVFINLLRSCCDGREQAQSCLANLLCEAMSGNDVEQLLAHPLVSIIELLFQFSDSRLICIQSHPDSWDICPFSLPLSLSIPTVPAVPRDFVVNHSEEIRVTEGRTLHCDKEPPRNYRARAQLIVLSNEFSDDAIWCEGVGSSNENRMKRWEKGFDDQETMWETSLLPNMGQMAVWPSANCFSYEIELQTKWCGSFGLEEVVNQGRQNGVFIRLFCDSTGLYLESNFERTLLQREELRPKDKISLLFDVDQSRLSFSLNGTVLTSLSTLFHFRDMAVAPVITMSAPQTRITITSVEHSQLDHSKGFLVHEASSVQRANPVFRSPRHCTSRDLIETVRSLLPFDSLPFSLWTKEGKQLVESDEQAFRTDELLIDLWLRYEHCPGRTEGAFQPSEERDSVEMVWQGEHSKVFDKFCARGGMSSVIHQVFAAAISKYKSLLKDRILIPDDHIFVLRWLARMFLHTTLYDMHNKISYPHTSYMFPFSSPSSSPSPSPTPSPTPSPSLSRLIPPSLSPSPPPLSSPSPSPPSSLSPAPSPSSFPSLSSSPSPSPSPIPVSSASPSPGITSSKMLYESETLLVLLSMASYYSTGEPELFQAHIDATDQLINMADHSLVQLLRMMPAFVAQEASNVGLVQLLLDQLADVAQIESEGFPCSGKKIPKMISELFVLTQSNQALRKDLQSQNPSKEKQENKTWATGVGYATGSGGGTEFFETAYEEMQQVKASRVRFALGIINLILRTLISSSVGASSEILETLRQSCLIRVLVCHFRSNSLLDIMKNLPLYMTLFETVECLCDESLVSLLLPENEPNKKGSSFSLFSVLSSLNGVAEHVLKHAVKIGEEGEGEESSTDSQVDLAKEFDSGNFSELSVAKHIIGLWAATKQAVFSSQGGRASDEECFEEEEDEFDEESAYQKALAPHQLGDYEMDLSGKTDGHHFASVLGTESSVSRKKLVRLIQEVTSMQSGLPLNPASSVFVRTDSDRMDVMEAMIVGPPNTPYSGGIFLFDLYCPPNYPAVPPKVNLRTTGHNTVRFNPNLYVCGKVCLSLLGTWSGQSGEVWQPKISSILQVWVSIQSLIFVDEPYFNEPGYERLIGTTQGQIASRAYNQVVREQTIRWAMIDQLENPKPGFVDVIHLHFGHRVSFIMAQLEKWLVMTKDEKQRQNMANLIERLACLFEEKLGYSHAERFWVLES